MIYLFTSSSIKKCIISSLKKYEMLYTCYSLLCEVILNCLCAVTSPMFFKISEDEK